MTFAMLNKLVFMHSGAFSISQLYVKSMSPHISSNFHTEGTRLKLVEAELADFFVNFFLRLRRSFDGLWPS